MRATIAALHVYPIKGCRGIGVDRADVTVRGLAVRGVGDREWMVVDSGGKFVSQREHPRMALIGVAADDGRLALDAPAMPSLEVASPDVATAARHQVIVWNSTVAAMDAGDDAARWLSAFLGTRVRLVRFAPEHVRNCNPEFVGVSGAHTAFADGYPLLVIGEASLAELNARLAAQGKRALPMNRFRPNVVVAGLEAHDEDHLDTIAVGAVTLRLVKPCARCQVTTTDQDDATVGREPLETLATYRMNERFGGVTFGMNAIVVAGAGESLAVGAQASVEYRF
jgi:uncharacterized protein YcbX